MLTDARDIAREQRRTKAALHRSEVRMKDRLSEASPTAIASSEKSAPAAWPPPWASPLFRLVSDHLHRRQTVNDERSGGSDAMLRRGCTVSPAGTRCATVERGTGLRPNQRSGSAGRRQRSLAGVRQTTRWRWRQRVARARTELVHRHHPRALRLRRLLTARSQLAPRR